MLGGGNGFPPQPEYPPMTEATARDYVVRAASLLDLPLAPEHLPGVVIGFSRLGVAAGLLAEFSCPMELESAPVFEP